MWEVFTLFAIIIGGYLFLSYREATLAQERGEHPIQQEVIK